jgi:hypothetical protein
MLDNLRNCRTAAPTDLRLRSAILPRTMELSLDAATSYLHSSCLYRLPKALRLNVCSSFQQTPGDYRETYSDVHTADSIVRGTSRRKKVGIDVTHLLQMEAPLYHNFNSMSLTRATTCVHSGPKVVGLRIGIPSGTSTPHACSVIVERYLGSVQLTFSRCKPPPSPAEHHQTPEISTFSAPELPINSLAASSALYYIPSTPNLVSSGECLPRGAPAHQYQNGLSTWTPGKVTLLVIDLPSRTLGLSQVLVLRRCVAAAFVSFSIGLFFTSNNTVLLSYQRLSSQLRYSRPLSSRFSFSFLRALTVSGAPLSHRHYVYVYKHGSLSRSLCVLLRHVFHTSITKPETLLHGCLKIETLFVLESNQISDSFPVATHYSASKICCRLSLWGLAPVVGHQNSIRHVVYGFSPVRDTYAIFEKKCTCLRRP